jgi:hypothetical protein
MKKLVPFLIITVILLPVAAYFLGTPPSETQLSILRDYRQQFTGRQTLEHCAGTLCLVYDLEGGYG